MSDEFLNITPAPDEWPEPEITERFDWSMSMRDMEEKYLGKINPKKRKYHSRIPTKPIPSFKITPNGFVPDILPFEKDLYFPPILRKPKVTVITEKKKFDDEADRQKKEREKVLRLIGFCGKEYMLIGFTKANNKPCYFNATEMTIVIQNKRSNEREGLRAYDFERLVGIVDYLECKKNIMIGIEFTIKYNKEPEPTFHYED